MCMKHHAKKGVGAHVGKTRKAGHVDSVAQKQKLSCLEPNILHKQLAFWGISPCTFGTYQSGFTFHVLPDVRRGQHGVPRLCGKHEGREWGVYLHGFTLIVHENINLAFPRQHALSGLGT